MKVLVDFREAANNMRAGKGEYVHQLMEHLIQQTSDLEFKNFIF